MDILTLPEMYQTLKITQAKTFQLQVPVDGSLELLALGDMGLLAWRAAKNQFTQSQMELNTPDLNQ